MSFSEPFHIQSQDVDEFSKDEFALVILRAKLAYHPSIDQWLEAFVYFFLFSL